MKFALVSHVLPPSSTGQAMVLGKILNGIQPDEYCLVSQKCYAENNFEVEYTKRLPVHYHQLTPGWQLTRGYRWGMYQARQVINSIIAPLAVRIRAHQIATIVQQEGCRAIIACTGDLIDIPAAYLASVVTGTAFYTYIFDDFRLQWTVWSAKRYASRMERICLTNAAGIIVPNEFMCRALHERYGVSAIVIHNPCDLSLYQSALTHRFSMPTDEVRIVFTGSIYEAHFDAIRNLVEAIKQLKNQSIILHIYTTIKEQFLNSKGISGPVVIHPHVTQAQIPMIQQQADVLFLPLAFDSPYPELIKTSAPGKMGEYLAAGRPILVHAPADSFISWYFRNYGCGLVVDKDDPTFLAKELNSLLSDNLKQTELSTQALIRSRSDYGISAVQRIFADLLQVQLVDTDMTEDAGRH